jgi:ribose 5-phosphate isomerase B
MIYLGSDHAGFNLKEKIRKYLERNKISYFDLSPILIKGDDYPLIAKKVGKIVIKNKGKGILVCGSGTGVSIAANKIKGVRASLISNPYQAKKFVEDDNGNILCLQGKKTLHQNQIALVKIFLRSKFSNLARHKRRVKQI